MHAPAPPSPGSSILSPQRSPQGRFLRVAGRVGLLGMLLLGGFAFTAPAASAQQVWKVTKTVSGGGDFTQIQPAVDAAAEGDVIVVRAGAGPDYAGFRVIGKSLTIVGDPFLLGGSISIFPGVQGRMAISDLGPEQSVVLRSMRFVGTSVDQAVVKVANNRGTVALERLEIEGFSWESFVPGERAMLEVIDSEQVLLSHCRIGPGGNGGLGQFAFSGARFANSHVALQGGWVRGGPGSDGFTLGEFTFQPRPGGFGLALEGGTMWLDGTEVSGGPGGKGAPLPSGDCLAPQPGGAGLLVDGGALLVARATPIAGGAGGPQAGGFCAAGADGAPLVVTDGDVSDLSGTPRYLHSFTSKTQGQGASLRIEGQPGDLVLLAASGAPSALAVPGVLGLLALGDPVPVAFLTLPANGWQQFDFGTQAAVPPGAQALRAFFQGLVLPADGGEPQFTAPTAVVVLAPGIL